MHDPSTQNSWFAMVSKDDSISYSWKPREVGNSGNISFEATIELFLGGWALHHWRCQSRNSPNLTLYICWKLLQFLSQKTRSPEYGMCWHEFYSPVLRLQGSQLPPGHLPSAGTTPSCHTPQCQQHTRHSAQHCLSRLWREWAGPLPFGRMGWLPWSAL